MRNGNERLISHQHRAAAIEASRDLIDTLKCSHGVLLSLTTVVHGSNVVNLELQSVVIFGITYCIHIIQFDNVV
jgi:hypothetical protein